MTQQIEIFTTQDGQAQLKAIQYPDDFYQAGAEALVAKAAELSKAEEQRENETFH